MTDQIDQSAPAVTVTALSEEVAETIVTPNVPLVVEDVKMAYLLAMEVKQKLNGKHPNLFNIFTTFLHLL